jgi:hypothetical protein
MVAMRAAGIHVVESPAMIGETMEKVLRRRGLIRSLPVKKKTATVKKKTAPARKKTAPVRRKGARSKKKR